MATKAPIPSGVAELVFRGDHGLLQWSVWFTLFMPEAFAPGYHELRDLWGVASEAFIDVIANCCSINVHLRTCRLALHSSVGLVVVDDAVTTEGNHASDLPEPLASVSRWETSYAGRSGHALTRLPGVPAAWLLDEGWLSNEGVTTTQAELIDFQNNVEAFVSPSIPVVRLCTLRRRTTLGPLPHAELFFPDACRTRLRLGTIGARLRSYSGDPHSLVP